MLRIRPAQITATALNDVTLTCTSIRGTPDIYSWHRVDGDIPPRSSGQNSSRLTIHGIVSADEGEYYCSGVQFEQHCAKSNIVHVGVDGKIYDITHAHLFADIAMAKIIYKKPGY